MHSVHWQIARIGELRPSRTDATYEYSIRLGVLYAFFPGS
jgi:hypothetical protein